MALGRLVRSIDPSILSDRAAQVGPCENESEEIQLPGLRDWLEFRL